MCRGLARATTLVETLIAAGLVGLLAVGAGALLIAIARQTRVNFATEMARRQATLALDVLTQHLREASVDLPLQFLPADAAASGEFTAVRLHERGPEGAWTWAEFRLRDGSLIHDPDLTREGDEVLITRAGDGLPRLTALRFRPLTDAAGTADHTAAEIEVTVSDLGATRTWAEDHSPICLTLAGHAVLRARGGVP